VGGRAFGGLSGRGKPHTTHLHAPHPAAMLAVRPNLTLCPVCLDFVEDVRLAAPCGHALCRGCAQAVRKMNDELRCPTCRSRVGGFQDVYAQAPTWAQLLDAQPTLSVLHQTRQQVAYHRAEACRASRLVRTLERFRRVVTGPLLARARASLARRDRVVAFLSRWVRKLVARRVRLRRWVGQFRAAVLLRKERVRRYEELVTTNLNDPEALLAALLQHGYARWLPKRKHIPKAVQGRENRVVIHHTHCCGHNGYVMVARELSAVEHLLPRPQYGCCRP